MSVRGWLDKKFYANEVLEIRDHLIATGGVELRDRILEEFEDHLLLLRKDPMDDDMAGTFVKWYYDTYGIPGEEGAML
jgi:hypothetical protein